MRNETSNLCVVEAVAKKGVVVTPYSEVIARSTHTFTRSHKVADVRKALDFLTDQIGKPYDFWGAFGLGLHRDWQKDDSWWCSELVEAMFVVGGSRRFIADLHRVTPQHSWMVV